MNYFLIWTQRAYDDLADIWVASDVSTRERIEKALLRLNEDLRINPWPIGESREANVRMVFVGPIGVVFQIEEAEQTVRVGHVWKNGK